MPEQADGTGMPEDWSAWSRDAQRLMQERNAAWRDRFALQGQPYRWDLETGTLRFERSDDDVVAEARLVGTVSESEGTFLWSWANEGLALRARNGLEPVREFGKQHGLTLLNTPEFRGDRAQGMEMLATAARILDAEGLFIDRTQDVTFFFALFRFEVRHKNQPAGSVQHLTLPVLDDAAAQEIGKEVVEAEPGGNGCWRLLHSPALVDGAARGDLIRLAPQELRGFVVVERAGNLAIVVATPAGAEASCRRALEPAVLELGGICEGGPADTLIFSIPASAGFRPVEELFDGAAARKVVTTWWFGNVYGPGAKPLNWWEPAARASAMVVPAEVSVVERARPDGDAQHSTASEATQRARPPAQSFPVVTGPGLDTRKKRAAPKYESTFPTKGRVRARIAAGCLLILIGASLAFFNWQWAQSIWRGPRPITLEELSSIVDLSTVQQRWVSFDFIETIDTGVRITSSRERDQKFILIQVKKSWLVAVTPASFASTHIEGYIENWSTPFYAKALESIHLPPGGRWIPYALDAQTPQRQELGALAIMVTALVYGGLRLTRGK